VWLRVDTAIAHVRRGLSGMQVPATHRCHERERRAPRVQEKDDGAEAEGLYAMTGTGAQNLFLRPLCIEFSRAANDQVFGHLVRSSAFCGCPVACALS
jgi:hypothetical protein